MKRKGYRGKRRGLSAEQAIAFAAFAMAAILLMTMVVGGKWTGQSVGEQIHSAICETKDWE